MQTVSILRQIGSKITTEIYPLTIKVGVIGAIAVAKAVAKSVVADVTVVARIVIVAAKAVTIKKTINE